MAGGSVCAACMYRSKEFCGRECLLAAYFPAEMYEEYKVVRLFHDDCNITGILDMVPAEEDKRAAVRSLIAAAKMRKADPVYGIVGVELKLRLELEAVRQGLERAKKQLADVKEGR